MRQGRYGVEADHTFDFEAFFVNKYLRAAEGAVPGRETSQSSDIKYLGII